MSWTSFNDKTKYVYQAVTIASGSSLTAAIDMQGYALLRIDLPGAWTAASLTFQVSVDGTNYVNLYKDGSEYTKSEAAASCGVAINPADAVLLHRYLKIRSGTAASPVNQQAARTLTLVAAPIF